MRHESLNVGELTVDRILGGDQVYITGVGKKLYVDSEHGSDGNTGLSPSTPLASVFGTSGALAKCVNAKGDIIFLLPGHSETKTTAGTIDKSGVRIIGLGNGDNRPLFTINAAIPGINITAHDILLHNVRILAGSSVTAATRLLRIAADDVRITKCRFEMGYDMYHMIVVFSGDDVTFEECQMYNAVTTNADAHPQTGLLNIGGTNTIVRSCRFYDLAAKKAERWRGCVEGGKLTARLSVEKCDFVCRGVATRTRSAAASGYQATIDCRGISPSSNTATGAIFTPTCQHCIETYDVAAVNKIGVVTVTTA